MIVSLEEPKTTHAAIMATLNISCIHMRCRPTMSDTDYISTVPPHNRETLMWWLVKEKKKINCLFVPVEF